MTKSILLVNPWIHDFSAYDLWMKPLGLLYIGALLERHNYKVYLIDCLNSHSRDKEFGCGELPYQIIPKPVSFTNIPRKYKRYGISPEVFSKELTRLKSITSPIIIAVTAMMTYWYPGVFETIRHIKTIFPDVPIVLGGTYPTLCYEHAIKHSGADYVIKGPGEIEVFKVLNQLTGQQLTIQSDKNPHLDDLPYPAYHLYKSIPYVVMLSSRGCPFSCTYCASSLLYNEFYQRLPEKVFAEIKYYVDKFDVKDIAFYDDALLVNPEKHIEVLLDLIIKKGINQKVRFHTPNGLHIRYITPNLAKKLYKAGFKTIRLGLESTQSHWQANSNNKVTNDEFFWAITNLMKAGYSGNEIGVYVMIGLPGQTLEEINETIDFVRQTGCKVKIAQYTPIPGTADFYKSVNEHGLDPNEPLLQNKSIYQLKSSGISFNEMERIKDKVKKLDLINTVKPL